ncbi:potassium-transporting ATPase subunit F [Shewanella sp. 4t3-1-2LB]|nr:potassium-transporting ATPase subunit F [Shewanella sp. 4t3-1-2LB]
MEFFLMTILLLLVSLALIIYLGAVMLCPDAF